RAPAYLTVPAPLPGYALAPFALLALLPFGIAAFVWTLVVLASLIFTVMWMRALTSLPATTVVAALVLSDGYVGVTLGQIAPLAIAAVVGAALAVQREKLTLAACAAALAMIEPHIGLPACIALAVCRPKALAPLALCAAVLAALSVALLGWPLCHEYLTAVLSAHAFSEVNNVKQLSFAYILHRFGVGASLALAISDALYVALIAIGIAVASTLARRTGRTSLLILVPVALAVAGAPFTHIAQIAAVVPAALVLLDIRRDDVWLVPTVILLAVPWPQFASLGTTFPLLAALVAGTLAYDLVAGRARTAAIVIACALAFFATALPADALTAVADPSRQLLASYDARALAETSWSAYVNTVGTQNQLAYDMARAPTWLALLLLCYRLGIAATSSTKPRC
ncbi:MAG TPA: glycosyltransferase 87 family protein, partial [Candidatus Acidoferrales bacterium]|nr:glycosyltransferase 87 family protein [Candidatus Acidoferrales bacterium]